MNMRGFIAGLTGTSSPITSGGRAIRRGRPGNSATLSTEGYLPMHRARGTASQYSAPTLVSFLFLFFFCREGGSTTASNMNAL